jgi:hypothetical protein
MREYKLSLFKLTRDIKTEKCKINGRKQGLGACVCVYIYIYCDPLK